MMSPPKTLQCLLLLGLLIASFANTCEDLSCESREKLLEVIRDMQEERNQLHMSHGRAYVEPRMDAAHARSKRYANTGSTASTTADPSHSSCNICESQPCLNGGTCMIDIASESMNYKCVCPDNCGGDHCEKNITCTDNSCGDNADCFVSNHQTNCVCKEGYSSGVYTGLNVEFIANPRHGCHTKTVKSCASGDPHFITFDSLRFDYHGTCPYVFSEPCGNLTGYDNYKVVAKNKLMGNSRVSYVDEVEVTMYGQQVHIDGSTSKVYFNGEKINVPYYWPNQQEPKITVTYAAGRFSVENDQMITVTFTRHGTLCVQVPDKSEFRGNHTLCGVAGNINDDYKDDVVTRNGMVYPATSPRMPPANTVERINFAKVLDTWITDDFLQLRDAEDSCIPGETLTNSTVCNSQEASNQCDPIKKAAMGEGPFSACQNMGDETITNLYENCVFDVCNGVDKCEVFTSFVRESMKTLPNTVLTEWRSQTNCPLTCLPHSHYSPCMSSCPATCAEPSVPDSCHLPCSEGCSCDDGYVVDNTITSQVTCIPLEDCGCLDENGNSYSANHPTLSDNCKLEKGCRNGTFYSEPNTCSPNGFCGRDDSGEMACLCNPGCTGDGCVCPDNCAGDHCEKNITCTENSCGDNADCYVSNHQTNCVCKDGYSSEDPRHGCHTKTVKSCALGDPHFITFDSLRFDYHGKCPYVFSEPCGNLTGYDNYKVVAKNKLMGNSRVSYVDEVEVTMYGQQIHIDGSTSKVYFNGEKINVPYYWPNQQERKITVTYAAGTFSVKNDQMVLVTFTRSATLCVQVPDKSEFRGNHTLCGVAGNINDDYKDDVVTRNGTVYPVTNPRMPPANTVERANFAKALDTWITDDFLQLRDAQDSCIPGEILANSTDCNSQEASNQCDPIKKAAVGEGPFFAFQNMGNDIITNLYENCVFDVCHGVEKCEVMTSFVRECMQTLPNTVLTEWRSQTNCPLTCLPHSHYSSCKSSCPATCAAPSVPDSCHLPCSEGCSCDDGYVVDNTITSQVTCIPLEDCGCLDENGNSYSANHPTLSDNCKLEKGCRNGTFYSEPITLSPNGFCGRDDSGEMACLCNPGFTGDGYNCTKINECLDPESCSVDEEHGTCINSIESCEEGWYFLEDTNSCYKFIEQRMNFSVAQESCQAEGAQLTSIQDETENQFVVELSKAEEKGSWSEMIWIGMVKNDDLTLKWVDGSEFSTTSYKNWASRQPDNQWSKCTQMLVSFDSTVDVPGGKDGQWDDTGCYTKLRGGVCKKAI